MDLIKHIIFCTFQYCGVHKKGKGARLPRKPKGAEQISNCKSWAGVFPLSSSFLGLPLQWQMSHDMTKPTKWVCAQQRLRSAWASAQSDQSLRCPHEETGHPPSLIRVFAVRMKKAWVLSYPLSAQRRLWSDWSESSLGAHSFCWFCQVAAQMIFLHSQIVLACWPNIFLWLPVLINTEIQNKDKNFKVS